MECVCFLLALEAHFPANTCLTAPRLPPGSQGRHSIAQERPCENKSLSSTPPEVPAGPLGAGEQSGAQEGREEKQFQIPGAGGLLQTAVVGRERLNRAWWRLGKGGEVEVRGLHLGREWWGRGWAAGGWSRHLCVRAQAGPLSGPLFPGIHNHGRGPSAGLPQLNVGMRMPFEKRVPVKCRGWRKEATSPPKYVVSQTPQCLGDFHSPGHNRGRMSCSFHGWGTTKRVLRFGDFRPLTVSL